MKKRVFIVHGWGSKPTDHWQPWLKAELEKKGFEVHVPTMPNTDEPKIEEWVQELKTEVGELNEQTYFVGHSVGCQAIIRYLETQRGKQAGGCVLVAAWFKLENLPLEEIPIAEPWQKTPIDFQKVLSVTRNFTVLISDNDDYDAVEENAKLFTENLQADVQILHERGHFTTFDGVTILPEALEPILRYSGQ